MTSSCTLCLVLCRSEDEEPGLSTAGGLAEGTDEENGDVSVDEELLANNTTASNEREPRFLLSLLGVLGGAAASAAASAIG